MSLPRKLPRDHRDLAKAALAAGWTITRAASNHLVWRDPDGRPMMWTASTPSDVRALANNRAKLRRAGLPV